ncbi:hypothetical protein HBI23_155680 [Parastagonospora nodorum]|nr:hypothetical protein HBI79_145010 [Parastagonospora nodorum]KAH5299074.1 hypothetical protein HBI12_200480 [Parastagonospora nodorum]KAH5412915.1 hypothetical protein HBI47_154160 [Parastagonospora nodorum]KAH5654292.1 hypothetical protein HBI23_155680 [Parastagonospora nodorum]
MVSLSASRCLQRSSISFTLDNTPVGMTLWYIDEVSIYEWIEVRFFPPPHPGSAEQGYRAGGTHVFPPFDKTLAYIDCMRIMIGIVSSSFQNSSLRQTIFCTLVVATKGRVCLKRA